MKTRWIISAFGVAAFLLCRISGAQESRAVLLPPQAVFSAEEQGKDKDKGKQPPDKKKEPETKALEPDLFTRAPVTGNELPTGFNPHMLGDFGTYFVRRTVFVTGTKRLCGSV